MLGELRAGKADVDPHVTRLAEAVFRGDLAEIGTLSAHFVAYGELLNKGVIAACAASRPDLLKRFQESGADLAATGIRASIWACRSGSAACLRYLHEHGVGVIRSGSVLMMEACTAGAIECVRYLHQHGVDVTASGAIFLREACASGSLRCVQYLHQNGVPIGPWDLGFAVAAAGRGDSETLKYLAASGVRFDSAEAELIAAAPEALRPVIESALADDRKRRGGFDASLVDLVLAARNKDREKVKTLHEMGAQPCFLSAASRLNLHGMFIELAAAGGIYQPSKFWEFFNDSNMRFLAWGGEESFKRTINQNYFNFIPESAADPKVLRAEALQRELGLSTLGDYELEDPDFDPALWCSWYDSYLLFKGDRELRLALYKKFVATSYEYALRADRLGLLADMEEPLLGNPIRIRRRGKLISQDLANSTLELNTFLRSWRLRRPSPDDWFAELGAGYGRIGALLLARLPGRYAVFDIPPALHVSQWYLSALFPERRVFRFRHFERFADVQTELEQAQIAFFTPNQLALVPEGFFAASMTISSLHEMRGEQIAHYLDLLSRKTRRSIYIKQQWKYPNPHDHITITASDYPVPSGWRSVLQRTDRLNPEFFERVMERGSLMSKVFGFFAGSRGR